MKQEASQELIHAQSHEALLVAMRGIAPAEGDVAIGERDQPGVRDGDAMRVGAEITQHMFRSELSTSRRIYAAILRRRTEFGRPAWSIRLRTATPTAASALWPEKVRARRQGPMMALYRPIAVSTRARCP